MTLYWPLAGTFQVPRYGAIMTLDWPLAGTFQVPKYGFIMTLDWSLAGINRVPRYGAIIVMNVSCPKFWKRYISYIPNLFKLQQLLHSGRAVTVNFLEFSKCLSVCYTRLVPSTRQCRHSSLYYQECNELLTLLYIIYVTLAAYTFCHFSARLYSTRLLTGFPRTTKGEEHIF